MVSIIYFKCLNYPDAIETGKEGLRLNQFYKELMVSTGSLEIEHGSFSYKDCK
jgi:hypothetical protein